MSVKVLVTQIGQQLIADTKQIENKDTKEVVGYWVSQPRLVSYTQDEEGNVGVNFGNYCLVSNEAEFSLRADHIVAILEPRPDVAEGYTKLVYPEDLEDGTDTASAEEPVADVDLPDGTVGDGAEGAPVEADGSVGEDETVPAEVA